MGFNSGFKGLKTANGTSHISMAVTGPSGVALKSTEVHSDEFWLEPQ